jgi:hypothetical protein
MPQKICIISFDHWNYDRHIVSALQKKGVESFHIKIGGFKHANLWSRFTNTMSKLFLNKNPKLQKRQEYIINALKEKGIQDQILVLNPELIEKKYHHEIKKYTNNYMAYLYDSVSRCPVEHLLEGIFDKIYSFDKDDIKNYGFQETCNYIYDVTKLPETDVKTDVIYIGSIDDRLKVVNGLGNTFEEHKIAFKFFAVGKKATVYKLKQLLLKENQHINFKRKRFSQEETLSIYKESKVILDIVRENQTGLSFRIFEAIGLNKNVVTNNKNILNYDIYNSNKIKLLENLDNKLDFSSEFYSKELLLKYHIDYWVKNIFKL